jgi:hypothetical protein
LIKIKGKFQKGISFVFYPSSLLAKGGDGEARNEGQQRGPSPDSALWIEEFPVPFFNES